MSNVVKVEFKSKFSQMPKIKPVDFEPKHKIVKVLGNDHLVQKMFGDRGYTVIPDHAVGKEPDLVCWTGGADVNPELYGHKNVASEGINKTRDRQEAAAFSVFKDYPKVGICRGGQFLNVMSGGRMWQDINRHGGTHDLLDLLNGETIQVTSTHHQMMIAGKDGEVIGIAHLASKFISGDPNEPKPNFDIEVVYYEPQKAVCFQPHPEYVGNNHPCNMYFFNLINFLL